MTTPQTKQKEIVTVKFNIPCILVKDEDDVYHPNDMKKGPLELSKISDDNVYPSAMKMDLAVRDNLIMPNTEVKMLKSEAEPFLKAVHKARGHKMGVAKTYERDPMLYTEVPVAELVA
jgi:hypothetical protein